MTVEAAVLRSPYRAHWKRGLGARRQQDKSNKRITAKKGTPISGSIDLDKATGDQGAWDYLIGLEDRRASEAIFAEVHRVDDGELQVVLNKLDWLVKFITKGLKGLPKNRSYYWIATKGVYISDRKRAIAAKRGLEVVPRLELRQ